MHHDGQIDIHTHNNIHFNVTFFISEKISSDILLIYGPSNYESRILGHTEVHNKTGLSESELSLQKALRERERERERDALTLQLGPA